MEYRYYYYYCMTRILSFETFAVVCDIIVTPIYCDKTAKRIYSNTI